MITFLLRMFTYIWGLRFRKSSISNFMYITFTLFFQLIRGKSGKYYIFEQLKKKQAWPTENG